MPRLAARTANDLAEFDDGTLVALATDGDEAAIRVIVQRYNRRLFRAARSVLGDDMDAEDAVQDAYVRAFTNLAGFRGEAGLSTWLTRIVLNEAFGRLRRRRPASNLETAEAVAAREDARLIMFPSGHPYESPEADTGRRQVRDLLQQAIDRLPEEFRLVFVLRDVEELSIEETAAHLGIKPATVKTRLHRARKLLRSALDRQLFSMMTDLFPFAGLRCERMADRVVEKLKAEG